MRDTRTRRLRTATLAACGLLIPVVAPAADATADEARAVIEETVVQVLDILRDESQDAEQRRTSLQVLARKRFDFRTMSRLVLARDWRRLTDAQKAEFVEEFEAYLANDYGTRIERYEQEEVEVLGARVEPRGDVTVKTKIVGGANDGALVDYRMRKNDDWRIIDVVIEGISLVKNFRDQFREVMGREGPVGLIERMREKNAEHAAKGA